MGGSLAIMQLVVASLLAYGLVIVTAHPHGGAGQDGRLGRAGGDGARRKRSDDFVVIEAEEPRQGRLLISDTPEDNSGPEVANFRLPLPQSDDAVVIESGGDDEAAGRFLSDIPRDFSGPEQAGFKLPKPDLGSIVEVFDDFEV